MTTTSGQTTTGRSNATEKKETHGTTELTVEQTDRERVIQKEVISFLKDQIATETPMETKTAKPATSKTGGTKKQKTKDSKKKKEKEKAKKKAKRAESLCKVGDMVGDRFRVVNKFKQGGFGQIYKAIDTQCNNTEVALKLEHMTEYFDKLESYVLKKLQNQPHCPIMYGSGSSTNYVYVAMQLLGLNLSDARRLCYLKPQRLSVGASFRVTVQCLEALETLHNLGYLHRDIKPSNFAVGCQPNDQHVVYMLDFGLCRYFLSDDGSVKPARPKIGFRGTVRYASVAAHELQDLSRRDDLWSLFYSFYELLIGQLHWRNSNDKEEVLKIKLRHTPESMCHGLPKEVNEFTSLIRELKFEDKPRYEEMYACLNRFLHEINVNSTDLYDWQVEDCRSLYHWLRSKRSKKKKKK